MERHLQTWTKSGDQCDPVRVERRVNASVSERERSQSTGRELNLLVKLSYPSSVYSVLLTWLCNPTS